MSHFYQTVYGKSIASIGMNGIHNGMANGNDPHAVVEDPEILKLQKQQEQKQKEAAALAAANEHRFGDQNKLYASVSQFYMLYSTEQSTRTAAMSTARQIL